MRNEMESLRDEKMTNRNIRTCRAKLYWTYETIRPYLLTGDQVLFRGKGLISSIICWLTGGDKSHIGTVIKNQFEIQLLEADWGSAVKGLQLSLLGEKIRKYKGEVYVRFLNCDRTPSWYQDLYNYIEQHRGTSYGFGKSELFCSKTSAEIFKKWNYLPSHIPDSNYTPEDFDEGGKVDVYMREASLLIQELCSEKSIFLSPCQRIIK